MLALHMATFNRLADEDKAAVRSWLHFAGFDAVNVVGVEAPAEDGVLDVVCLVRPLSVVDDAPQTYRVSVKADGFPLRLLVPDGA